MTLNVWLGFLLAVILLAVTPGPGAVLSMSCGMRYGYWIALRAILGLQTALLVHLLIIALGLGALLASSEAAFDVLKLAGALYLIWLGVQKWRYVSSLLDPVDKVAPSGMHYLQGILVNLTNPKAVLFTGALLPQFIDVANPLLPQYLIIAATMCLVDLLVMSVYALAAERIAMSLNGREGVQQMNRVLAALFVTVGAWLAISSRPT